MCQLFTSTDPNINPVCNNIPIEEYYENKIKNSSAFGIIKRNLCTVVGQNETNVLAIDYPIRNEREKKLFF